MYIKIFRNVFFSIIIPLIIFCIFSVSFLANINRKYIINSLNEVVDTCTVNLESYFDRLNLNSEFLASILTNNDKNDEYISTFKKCNPYIKEAILVKDSVLVSSLYKYEYDGFIEEIILKTGNDILKEGFSNFNSYKGFSSCIVFTKFFEKDGAEYALIQIINTKFFNDIAFLNKKINTKMSVLDSKGEICKYPYVSYNNLDSEKESQLINNLDSNSVRTWDYKNMVCISKPINGFRIMISYYSTNEMNYLRPYILLIILVTLLLVIVAFYIAKRFSKSSAQQILRLDDYMKENNFNCSFGERIPIYNISIEYLVNEYIRNLDSIKSSEQRYRSIVEMSETIVFEYNIKEDYVFFSEYFNKKFPFRSSTSRYKDSFFVNGKIHPDDKERFRNVLTQNFEDTNYIYDEYRFYDNFNSYTWYLMKAIILYDKNGNKTKIIGSFVDVNKQKVSELQLIERANYDKLSKLFNRDTFIKRLEKEYELSVIRKNIDALLFIDIDNFKDYNDLYTHAVGDDVIKHVGNILQTQINGDGFAGRYGGDEFVVCMNIQNTFLKAPQLAERITSELRKGIYIEELDKTLAISCSIGISFFTSKVIDCNDLIKKADEAMYKVKKNGKSGFAIYK